MAASTEARGEALGVRRTIAPPRQRVFEAWTTPTELKRWAGPGPLVTPLAEVDLLVGGHYRIHMREPNGSEHRVSGVYREVDPPQRLVYTWSWENDPEMVESLVTVEFHERGDATEVVLRHEGFRTKESRDRHETGWGGCLEKLATVVQQSR